MPESLRPLPPAGDIQSATPTVRLFNVLESIAAMSCHFTLQDMVQATGLPKPTVHRMLQQLEGVGIVQRDRDERHYALGVRMRTIANELLLNDSLYGARHAILRQLREEVGESCNLTAMSGGEVMYLDRVETAAPLRFYLHPGSRVPAHASATGKLFLGQMTPARRRHLLQGAPLERFTPNTLVEPTALAAEVDLARQRGWSVDNEEFLPGLVCIAVLVPEPAGASNLGVAMQGPSLRIRVDEVPRYLPALRRAADALARLQATADRAKAGKKAHA